jgi:hypothetical protein
VDPTISVKRMAASRCCCMAESGEVKAPEPGKETPPLFR